MNAEANNAAANAASNIATIQPNRGLVGKIAGKFGVDPDKLLPALKHTAFRQSANSPEITNEQMMALMIVADQYGLNPFTKEIFAFPDKGAIVPVVSVDGWSRIINENPQMDGIEFEYSPETIKHAGKDCYVWIDCIIHRKDRSKPIRVREFFAEVVRDMGPWKTHPNRMHRHKAEIQCARIAFGFAGIYDQDEAERIIEASAVVEKRQPPRARATEDQKALFDQMLAANDGIGLFLFSRSIDENQWIDLYHSFPRGQKGKNQDALNKLVEKGSATLRDITEVIRTAAAEGDGYAIVENLGGLPPEAITYIKEQCEPAEVAAIDDALKQAA